MSDLVNRDAWRAQVAEIPLEPELPIIDAHHHLWPVPMTPQMEAYGAEALLADKAGSGHNIVATVFVEANAQYRTEGPASLRPVGETVYAGQIGRDSDRQGRRAAGACAGIVAH